jgi:DNA-binding response OmpR family regulator
MKNIRQEACEIEGIVFVEKGTMKKRILIADDDAGIRDIFKIIFEKAGYEIDLKEDASDLLKNNFFLPDIFLIDKLLSGIDGLAICRYLKSNPKTCNIPVIMISASPDIGIQSAKAGADDFIEKPFDLNYLLEVVESNINRTKSKRFSKTSL